MFNSMTQQAQEEYIWAMRNSAFRSSDDQKLLSQMQKNRSILTAQTVFDQQTKVMASMVPDEVIQNVESYNLRHYDAAVLFGDISGFTELCEKYTKAGVSGPSRMTQALNNYLGSMVQEIMSHQGDVLKFSGDAFLALFKSSESDTMRDVVHAALDCALVIQQSYGAYPTDVGVVIRVKLAVSCGHITFSLIGDETNSHYIMVGKPVSDVKAAEKISQAGDIIVAPAAWYYINATEYEFQEMPDKIHFNVIGVGSTWRSTQKTVKSKQVATGQQQDINVDDNEISMDSSYDDDDDDDDIDNIGFDMDEFALRPAVNLASRLRIRDQLRKFIIAPVMKSIDMNEPFEYLTEMRQAVICFINVVSEKLSDDDTCIFTDTVYKTVCSIVNKMKGCVNKVSLFDKDLMLVIIFGLRGFKHELECQMALRCSHQVHEAITKIPNVITASLGVTAGKTYCGVFGHTLRREYTVISLICNKAARLMVKYPGQVTCDRESFLHSKLEAKHFVLQPAKSLKGISHPGPVYEFKETKIKHNVIDNMHPSPLLGRCKNCHIYNKLIENCLKTQEEQQYKMLLIEGEARQGKTRLLDELIYLTPDSIEIFKLTLTIKDYSIPYQGIRLLFYTLLNLTSDTSVKDKEQKLLNIFLRRKTINFLCVLNNIFGVDFKKSEQYLKLNKEEVVEATKFMLKCLCQAIFSKLWVIAFDNFEYLDDESWVLFDCFFDTPNLFFLATIGRENLEQFHYRSGLLNDLRIVINILTPIDKWYLGALACQILDVYAISPELENAIQTRSNGNPGWIESFLISSIQDNALHILEASLRDINDLGLVCPPLYMMQRLSPKESENWKHIMEEKHPPADSSNEDHWKKYIDSCRDSYLNITIREQIESTAKGGTATICIIAENFSVGEEETELSMDSMVLRTFDSLTFYEQLLVKCGAILGNQFLRSMLVYVMAETSPRKTALAVQKLFEIQVLTCAKGDFLEGARVFKEKYESPLEEIKASCKCRGVAPDETCLDLPKYASCGYLQFKSTLFRDITYNLLTNQQKKDFHSRAIRYLEKETRRCKACGYGFFENILRDRQKQDKEFLKKRDKRIRYEALREGSASTFGSDTASQRGSVNPSVSQEMSKRSIVLKIEEKSISSLQLSTDDTKAFVSSSFFGFTVINKLKNSFSLTRTFSSEDFSDCRCNLILSTTYAQLIDHCRGANEYIKLTIAHTEYAYVCLSLCNFPLAIRTLTEALYTIRDLGTSNKENAWKAALLRGKLYSMMGYAKLEVAHLDDALDNFNRSLQEYRLEFPTGSNRQCMIRQYKIKQKFGLYVFPSILMKHLDYWKSTFYNNLSECLSHLCRLYMIRDEWENAELAAYWSLTKAFEAFSDFAVIITACANLILVLQHLAEWSLSVALEVHALRVCHLKKSRVEKSDLLCVAKLYAAVFNSRVCRSELEKGIQMGYACMRISSSLHDIKILLSILPTLGHILLLCSHYDSASSILRNIEELFPEDTDYSAKIWYYALCVGMHLETGYCIMNYNACQESYDMEGENWIYNRDSEALRRFFTVMWLWCIRNEKWEQAIIWSQKTTNLATPKNPNSFTNRITDLYRLEGLIIFLVNKLDKRNIHAVIRAEDEIKHLIFLLEKRSRMSKILLPRLLHLKAYFKFVKNKDFEVHAALKKAQKVALQCCNELDCSWLEHSEKAWDNTLNALMVNFWREHCNPEKLLDYSELETGEGKLGFFTLNIPTYV